MTEDNSQKNPEDKNKESNPTPNPPKKPLFSAGEGDQEQPKKPTPPKTGATGPVPKTPTTPKTGATGPVPKTPSTPAAKPATPTAKPAAARPAGKPMVQARRHFIFTWLGLAWTAFALATGAALSTTLRFLYPNVLFEPKLSFKIGRPDDYEVGKVDTRWKDQFGVWVIRGVEGMYALSTVCTHLGCPPSWLESEQKFKCPCHGSGFYKSGIHFEGPAPRPLERFRITLADDGQVLIDKSKKFQQEKGEWELPESFLVV